MESIATLGDGEQLFRRYDYGDRSIVAVDFGVRGDAIEVDVLGDTAIVVLETDEGATQTEFELPDSATVETNNGVLTVVIEE